MDIVVIIAQFLLSLTILVLLHELGHFAPAKWFGARVERFYVFFHPWFSLFKVKRGDTEYGIGWLPLGGYVKISGMVDESFDKEQMKQEPQPWEFRSKPAWQRLIIMLGGVTVNFLLGFFIFAMLFWAYGETYLPNTAVKDGIYADSLGQAIGFRTGDKILKIGDEPFDKFNQGKIIAGIALRDASEIEVERNGEVIQIQVPDEVKGELVSSKNKNRMIVSPRIPFVVAQVADDFPAKEAGMMAEDRVVGVNDREINFYDEASEEFKANKNAEIEIRVLRNLSDTVILNLRTTEEGQIGVLPFGNDYYFEFEKQNYSLAAALPAGVAKGWNFLADQMKAFGQMFKGKIKASESLGGFASIANLFPRTWNWEIFWSMTAVLSLILAFMNLLPIPGLDGGHVIFLIFEVLTGRKVSDKVMETATMIGFVLIIALVLYANGLDVMRFFQK